MPVSTHWCGKFWQYGLPVITTKCSEPVVLGSAILGAVAGKVSPSVSDAMQQFTHVDTQYYPQQNYQTLHKQRYEAYQQLQALAKNCRE